MNPGLIIIWTLMIIIFWASGFFILAAGEPGVPGKARRRHWQYVRIWHGVCVAIWLFLSIATLIG